MNQVLEGGFPVNVTASALAKAGAGILLGIFVASASSNPTIKLWDNDEGSGTVIVNTFTPVAATFYRIPAQFKEGCYITIAGTVDCSLFFGAL